MTKTLYHRLNLPTFFFTPRKIDLEKIDASPNSPLGKARDYMLKRWEGFTNYLKDGHIEMTNNISERAVKLFVIARKNILFSFTKNGADSSAIYFQSSKLRELTDSIRANLLRCCLPN